MRLGKRLSLLFIVLLITVLGVACGNEAGGGAASNPDGGLLIQHDLGEALIHGKPERVVVFDYGTLDTLDRIEEDIIGLPQASLPDYLSKYQDQQYEDVGTLQEPNFEKIYELQPDLIIISDRQSDLYDEFTAIAPTVYLSMYEGDYMESFRGNLEILGKVFDKEDLVADELTRLDERVDKLSTRAKESGKRGLFLMANDGNLSVFGQGSRFDVLYNEFGIIPVDEEIDSSTHGQKISFEYLVEKDPDLLFVMDRAAIAGGEISAKQVLNNDLVKSIKAHQEDRIIYLDSPTWYVAAGGIRATEKMIEDVESSLE